MSAATDISQAVTSLQALTQIIHDVVHGNSAATVTTESGSVPSIAKKISDIGSAITTAFASGFILSVADSAGRAAAQASVVGQWLYQRDTSKLYIATSTAVGGFSLHPIQTALDNPSSTLDTISAALTTLNNWKSLVDSNGDGVVSSAESLKPVNDATAPEVFKFRAYGRSLSGVGMVDIDTSPRSMRIASAASWTNGGSLVNWSRFFNVRGVMHVVSNDGRIFSLGTPSTALVSGDGSQELAGRQMTSVMLTNNQTISAPSLSLDPSALAAKKIVRTRDVTAVLTSAGTLFVTGRDQAGIWNIFGTNAAVKHVNPRAVYFNASGVNATIVDFDIGFTNAVNVWDHTLVAFDSANRLWFMGSNSANLAFSNSLSGAKNTPVLITVSAWTGKTIKKVRALGNGSVFVLFTDGSLWACATNATGFLGLGNTTTQTNFTQIASSVADFELLGDSSFDNVSLFTLQGTTLFACGYNAQGQLGVGDLVNRNTHIPVTANVSALWTCGDGNGNVFIQKTDGTVHAWGQNLAGSLGLGDTTARTSPVSVSGLNTLLTGKSLKYIAVAQRTTATLSVALCTDGAVFAAGYGTEGQLADGTFANRSSWSSILFTPAFAGETITDIYATVSDADKPCTFAITSHGRLLFCGTGPTIGLTGLNFSTLTHVRHPF